MTIRNVVVVDNQEILIEDLPEDERNRLINNLNKEALRLLNYYEEKTA